MSSIGNSISRRKKYINNFHFFGPINYRYSLKYTYHKLNENLCWIIKKGKFPITTSSPNQKFSSAFVNASCKYFSSFDLQSKMILKKGFAICAQRNLFTLFYNLQNFQSLFKQYLFFKNIEIEFKKEKWIVKTFLNTTFNLLFFSYVKDKTILKEWGNEEKKLSNYYFVQNF